MAATKPNIPDFVNQMPEVDKPGEPSKFTGPEPAAAEQICSEILSGGRASLLELAELVKAPGDADFANYKAAYLLHVVALHAGRPGSDTGRRTLAEILAAQLKSEKHSKQAKAFFIQEMQWVGGREVVPALAAALADDELAEPATRALTAIRDGAPAVLRTALRAAKGRQRAGIVQALGRLADPAALPDLRAALRDDDADVRVAAGWALASFGDAVSAAAVLEAADKAQGWERVQHTKACLLLAEKLGAAGKKSDAGHIYTHLRDTRNDDAERHVRDAADRGLKALGTVPAA